MTLVTATENEEAVVPCFMVPVLGGTEDKIVDYL
jgi:hypothetical protein